MATETQAEVATDGDGRFSDHLRGVVVTTLACLAGVGAAFGSGLLVGTDPSAATDTRAVGVVAVAVGAVLAVLKAIGIDVAEFGVKDHLYVAFMTFTLWFITFTILLTTGVTL